MTYLSGNWYKEQAGFIKKLKKIWAIIRNKDFYYSEIILNKKDWEEYKKWINENEKYYQEGLETGSLLLHNRR